VYRRRVLQGPLSKEKGGTILNGEKGVGLRTLLQSGKSEERGAKEGNRGKERNRRKMGAFDKAEMVDKFDI